MDISIRDMNICPRIPLPRRVPNRTYTEGVKRTV